MLSNPPYIQSPEEVEWKLEEERQRRMVCTRKAFRLALLENDLLQPFKTVENIDPQFTIWFEDTSVFRYTNPYLQQVWFEYLEWGESQLQDLFERAMAIDRQYPE